MMAAWTPEELRAIAGAHATEVWIGTVRSALRHAADLNDAAHAVRDENERLRADLDSYMEAANGYMREVEAMRAERDALRAAIRWALGYDEGDPDFSEVANDPRKYAWRIELRRRAGPSIDAALAQTGANDVDR